MQKAKRKAKSGALKRLRLSLAASTTERKNIDMSEKRLPDVAPTSGDLHGPLFDSADPAAATRRLETDD